MHEHLDHEYRPWRLAARLFAGFGALALAVALIGVYTAVSYGVTERTRELGVRMALGARAQDVVRLVLRDSLRVVAVGVAVGIVVALAGGRLLSGLLYGVAASDATVMLLASASLLAAATAAALLPAWRAATLDPLISLKAD
jgi:putative ABC transport system permease protein